MAARIVSSCIFDALKFGSETLDNKALESTWLGITKDTTPLVSTLNKLESFCMFCKFSFKPFAAKFVVNCISSNTTTGSPSSSGSSTETPWEIKRRNSGFSKSSTSLPSGSLTLILLETSLGIWTVVISLSALTKLEISLLKDIWTPSYMTSIVLSNM